MPKVVKELSALEIRRMKHTKGWKNHSVAVGGIAGLMVQMCRTEDNEGNEIVTKSWLLRTKVGEKRKEFGLGSFPEVALATARDRARELKEKIRDGIDPKLEREAMKSALLADQRRNRTFDTAVDEYLRVKLVEFKNPKHQQQWRNTLMTYAVPELGSMLVQDITVQDVLRVLKPTWNTKTETASRVRGRIEAVLSWATVSGYREGDNPARWAGNLKELLPAPSKIAEETHHPAMQIDDVPRWITKLQNMEGMGKFALEFALLTATRSQEVRGAQWDEIDFDKGLWTIPAQRMKKGREHRVPLSDGAVRLLGTVPRFEGSELIFSAPRGGQLSDMTLSAAMKRLHKADLKETGVGFVDTDSC